LLRISPTGQVLAEVPIPALCLTMPGFGGADLKTLFITTSRHGRSEAELAHYPGAGCVWAMRVEVAGGRLMGLGGVGVGLSCRLNSDDVGVVLCPSDRSTAK
jgi:hypothetical protein